MFAIYYINHLYYAQKKFGSINAAIEYGKAKGFDFRVDQVHQNGKIIQMVCSWSIIRGLQHF